MMYWYGGGMGVLGFTLMAIGTILFWGALIGGVVALIRYLGHGGKQETGPGQPSPPESLLAERFARGEINDEEYQRRLAALRSAGQTAAPGNGKARPPAGTTAH